MEKINSFQGGHRWLSNFWIVPVMFEGHQYRSVEHAYVASKTTDPAIREQVRLIETPGAVKRFGRKIELRPDWEDVKLGFMEIMLRSKFRQERLRMLLISTGDAVRRATPGATRSGASAAGWARTTSASC